MPELVFALVVAVAVFAGIVAAPLLKRRLLAPARIVHEWEHGLLYVDGRFAEILKPGRYRVSGLKDRLILTLPRFERFETFGPVEATSIDSLSFRLSGVIAYTIVDPRAAHEGEYLQRLRLSASDALVRLAADRVLETVLAERASLGAAALAGIASVPGCTVNALTISAVTLPPELRRLYAEIERARLEGQAALERARGEQAALRSLANAARMLKGNPELMNLRLLQALSASGGKGATLVLGREAFAATRPAEEAAPEPEPRA